MRRLALVVLLTACTKEGGGGAASGSAAAGTPRDQVLAAWKTGGIAAPTLAPATVAFGKDCASGTVAKLDVLVCNYGSDKDAKAAEDPALAWIGDATGVSRARGSALIVVADRKKADPTGKTINELVTLPAR